MRWKTQAWAVVGLLIWGTLAWGGEAVHELTPVEFLEGAVAGEVMAGEEGEHYIEQFQPMEMIARLGEGLDGSVEAMQAQTREIYREAVRDFTPEEKEALRWYVSHLQPVLEEHYPRVASIPWRFIKVTTQVERGMPHTRDRAIVLSEPLLTAMVMARDVRGEGALRQFGHLLFHEQVHVWQRKNPDLFADLYERVWGFERAESIAEHPWLEQQQLTNPDAVDDRWVFPVKEEGEVRWMWPTFLLSEPREGQPPHMARDLQMVGVWLEKVGPGQFRVKEGEEGRPMMTPLDEVEVYQQQFPLTDYVAQPNEAFAEEFAVLAMKRLNSEQEMDGMRGPRVKELQAWLREHLGREAATQPAADGG